MFGLGSSPVAVTKPSGVTRSGEVRPDRNILLLESEKLGGEGVSLVLNIPRQEGHQSVWLQCTPYSRKPVHHIPEPDGTLGSVFSHHVQLNLSQDGIVD